MPTKNSKPHHHFSKFEIISSALIALIMTGVIIFSFTDIRGNFNDSPSKNSPKPPNLEEKLDNNQTTPITVGNLLLYQQGSDIMNQAKGQSQKLISLDEQELLISPHLIQGATLFYARCQKPENTSCRLMEFDLGSQQEKEIKALDPQARLIQIAWDKEDRYAYLIEQRLGNDLTWQLYLSENGQEKLLYDNQSVFRTKRSPFNEDDSQLSFSPQGDHLLHIRTESIRSPSDFVTYVFSLSSDHIQLIEPSTMPRWLTDDIIVYRDYIENTINLWYLENEFIKKIDPIGPGAYGLNVLKLGNDLAYWQWTDEGLRVFVYNFQDKKNLLIAEQAYLPHWINYEEIIYPILEDDSTPQPLFQGNLQEKRTLLRHNIQLNTTQELPFKSDQWLRLTRR